MQDISELIEIWEKFSKSISGTFDYGKDEKQGKSEFFVHMGKDLEESHLDMRGFVLWGDFDNENYRTEATISVQNNDNLDWFIFEDKVEENFTEFIKSIFVGKKHSFGEKSLDKLYHIEGESNVKIVYLNKLKDLHDFLLNNEHCEVSLLPNEESNSKLLIIKTTTLHTNQESLENLYTLCLECSKIIDDYRIL